MACLRALDGLFARPYSCYVVFASVANLVSIGIVLAQLLKLGGADVILAACEKPLFTTIVVSLAALLLNLGAAVYVFVRIQSHQVSAADADSPEALGEVQRVNQAPDAPYGRWYRSAHFCMYDIGMCLTITLYLFGFVWGVIAMKWDNGGALVGSSCGALATVSYSSGAALLTSVVVSAALAISALIKQFCLIPEHGMLPCLFCCCCCCSEMQPEAAPSQNARVPVAIQQQPPARNSNSNSSSQPHVLDQLAGAAIAGLVSALSSKPAMEPRAGPSSHVAVIIPSEQRNQYAQQPIPVQYVGGAGNGNGSSVSLAVAAPGGGAYQLGSWVCAQCTLENSPNSAVCDACQGSIRAAAAPPARAHQRVDEMEPGSNSHRGNNHSAPAAVPGSAAASSSSSSQPPSLIDAAHDYASKKLSAWFGK